MSASEKLGVLWARTATSSALNYGRVAALNELEAVLAQILAVVEAAELANSMFSRETPDDDLARALIDLDKAMP